MKERNALYLGLFIGIIIGIVLVYSLLYFSLIYSITHIPFSIGDIAFNIDINETELVDAMTRYMESDDVFMSSDDL